MIQFLALASIATGIAGLVFHCDAGNIEDEAESLIDRAKSVYEEGEASLKEAYGRTKGSLMILFYRNSEILEGPMARFLNSYAKIHDVSFTGPDKANQIGEFCFDEEDVASLRNLTDIYSNTLAAGGAGAAAGTAVALAASGALPLIADGLSIAGSCLAAGEFGVAAGLAGSALSFGVSMTPLAAIAGPVSLFTGISSDAQAQENLDEAQAEYAKAKEEVEKMKTYEISYNAISDTALEVNRLLDGLEPVLSELLPEFEEVISEKERQIPDRKLTIRDFSPEEAELIAVTKKVAAGIKDLICTPIANSAGEYLPESGKVCDAVRSELDDFV